MALSTIAHPGTLSSTQNAAGSGTAFASDNNAPVLFVNTVTGQAGNNGLTPANPMATITAAFAQMAVWEAQTAHSSDNTIINVLGVIAEQVTTPLSGESGVGVSGVTIQGLVGGNNRHDDGARWKEAAVAGGAPLITVRGQGWTFRHLLMVPETGYSAVRLRRQEDTTYPDGSHAVFENVRFMGNAALGTAAGIGIEDYGGQYNVSVDGCQFINLISAIRATNVSIAAPLMWRVGLKSPNVFNLCTNDIATNGSGWTVANNQFMVPYNVTTHPITLNLALTATTTYGNRVYNNVFADAAANVVIAKGYVKGNTSDVWRNFVTDTAAYIVTVPS